MDQYKEFTIIFRVRSSLAHPLMTGFSSPTRRDARRSVSLDRRAARPRSPDRNSNRVCAKDRLGARPIESRSPFDRDDERMDGRSSPIEAPNRGRDRLKSLVSKRVDEDAG